MANQVKFYAMTQEKYAATTNKNSSALYFVSDGNGDPGRIYKGSELFGAAKVYQVATQEALDAITDAVRGDIAIGYGSAKVYAKVEETWKWVDLGSDVEGVKEIVKDTFGDAIEWKTESIEEPVPYEGFQDKVDSEDLVKDDETGNYYEKDDDSKTPVADENGNALNPDGTPITNTVEKEVPQIITIETLNAGKVEADEISAENAEIGKADIGEATFADGEKIIIKEQVVKTENVPYEKELSELEELVNTEDNGWTKDDDGNYLKDGEKVADKDGNELDENGEIVTKEVTDSEGNPVMEDKPTTLPDYIKETVKQDAQTEVRDIDSASDDELATELAIRKAIDAAMKKMEMNWLTTDEDGNDVEL